MAAHVVSHLVCRHIVAGILLVTSSRGFGAVSNQALLELNKVTVGPFDNFQSALDKREQNLYYTRSQNLSSQIMRFPRYSGPSPQAQAPRGQSKPPEGTDEFAPIKF